MTHYYHLYGTTVSSDMHLPELNLSEGSGKVDVVIYRGCVASKELNEKISGNRYFHADEDSFWLKVDGVASFKVSGGQEIIYDPVDGVDEDSIRLFLLGSCVGALLFQRGFFVLHGNAFEVNGSCVICVGDSGAGKSTLAAEMMLRGHRIIADDVCPIDDSGNVLPGMPRIKLWKDSADKLGIDTRSLNRVRPGLDKFNYPLESSYCDTPLSVSAVYVLHKDLEDGFRMDSITGMGKYDPLKHNTYRYEYLKEMCLERMHFQKCGELAKKIQLTNLYRPINGFKLNELAEFILNDADKLSAA